MRLRQISSYLGLASLVPALTLLFRQDAISGLLKAICVLAVMSVTLAGLVVHRLGHRADHRKG